jgi:diguanylate cyclase (GGDEF)-like protein/PAS domain S-box-containing protein
MSTSRAAAPVVRRRRRWYAAVRAVPHAGALMLAAVLVLIPLTAGWTLHAIDRDAANHRAAAHHLQALVADINGVTATVAVAVAAHRPAQAIAPALGSLRTRVAGDIADLDGDAVATGLPFADIEQGARSLMRLVDREVPLLGTGAINLHDPAQVAALNGYLAQHDALISRIRGRMQEARHLAASSAWIADVGTWTIVCVMSVILVVVLWRAEERRRSMALARERNAALAASERTFHLLFERNPMPMWTCDPRTLRFLRVNAAAVARYGYSRDEFLTMTLVDIGPPEDREAFRRRLPYIRSLVPTTLRHLLKDGRLIDVEIIRDVVEMDGTTVWLTAVRDVTAQRDLERQLKHQALHDELTALPNRALFVDRLEHALRHQNPRGLAVMLLDVDNFKAVNDSYGHVAGDIVLMEMAGRMQSCLRAEDTVTRLGGDEFALVIEAGDERAVAVTRRLLDSLDEPFPVPGAPGVSVSASIGIAMADNGEGTGELLRNADVAMYVAKSTGKNRAVTFADAMHREVMRRTTIESTLHSALHNPDQHFELVYQPVYATLGKRVVGFEALLRWEHPEYGCIPPAELIPVAEATGAIIGLGRWVLEQACRQAAEWQRSGLGAGELRMSVNLSPVQCSDPGLVGDVSRVLAVSGLDPARLILEITETALVTEVSEMVRILAELKHLGVKLAVDDFGTGQSSLGNLARYPVDLLKIDRSFFGDGSDPSTRCVLQGTVELGRRLGLTVVAEGVETEQQAAMLSCMRGVFAQGYLYSRPLTVDAASALLEAQSAARGAGVPRRRGRG